MKTTFQRLLLLTLFLAAMLWQGTLVAQDCDNLLANPNGLQPVTTGWNVLQVSGNSPGFGQVSGTGFLSTYGGCGNLRWNRKAQTIDLVALGFDPAWLDNAPALAIEETFRTVVDNAFCTYPSGNALDLYYLKVELRDANQTVIATVNWGSTSSPLLAPMAGVVHSHTFNGYGSGLRYIYFEDGGMDAGWWAGFYGTQMEHPSVYFMENMDPVITCPANIVVDNDPGDCAAVVNYNVTYSDDCEGAVLSQINGIPSDGSFPVGTTTNTFRITDLDGRTAQCSFTVRVNDTEPPVALCQDITVNPDGSGNYNFSAANVDAGSYDNCEVDNISLDITWLSCNEASETLVTLTVEDIYGNTASCTATVTPTGDSDCDGVGDECDVCAGGDDSVDNNNDGLPDCRYPPAYNQIIADWKCGNNKVYVCQIPPGNPNAKKTICVSYNSLNAHLKNGSYLGQCGNASCQEPIAPRIAGNGGINGSVINTADILIYPNPAQDVVYIQFAEKEMPSQLSIYDQLGRLVWSETIAPGQVVTQLNLYQSRFSDGMYVVQILSEEGLQSKKLVIAR